MAYSLSFSPEFFYAEGEPYDCGEIEQTSRPESLYAALTLMPRVKYAQMVRDLMPRVPAKFRLDVDPIEFVDMARDTDTCSNLDSPVEVWIDPDGDWKVKVY